MGDRWAAHARCDQSAGHAVLWWYWALCYLGGCGGSSGCTRVAVPTGGGGVGVGGVGGGGGGGRGRGGGGGG